MVFFRHYGMTSHAGNIWMKTAFLLCFGGWMGVDLFFVLSGFLITGILLDTRELPGYFTNFYARRALRIFPLYYTVLALLFLMTPWLHLEWHTGHLAYLIYAGNIAYNLDPSLGSVRPAVSFLHLWSLAVEEQFYFVWPLLVILVGSWRRLAWICGGLSIGGLILRICLLLWLPRGDAYEWCYAQLPTHMDGLLFGALGAISVRAIPFDEVVIRAKRVLPFALATLLIVIAWGGIDFHSVPMIVVGFPALAATFACIVLFALKPEGAVNRICSLSGFRFVGRYSYGMYVYHILFWPVLAAVQPWLQSRLHSVVLGGVCFVLLMLMATMVTAVVSYEVYERQWLKLKGRFTYQKQAAEFAA